MERLQAVGLQQGLQYGGITTGEPQLPWPLRLGPVVESRRNRRGEPPSHTTGHGLSGVGGPNRICRLQMRQRWEIGGALMQRLQLQAPTSHQPPSLKTASGIYQRQA